MHVLFSLAAIVATAPLAWAGQERSRLIAKHKGRTTSYFSGRNLGIVKEGRRLSRIDYLSDTDVKVAASETTHCDIRALTFALLLPAFGVTHGVLHYSSGLVVESESGALAEGYVTTGARIIHHSRTERQSNFTRLEISDSVISWPPQWIESFKERTRILLGVSVKTSTFGTATDSVRSAT